MLSEKLGSYLKDAEVMNLLNSQDFYSLFHNCPKEVRKELLETLDAGDISIATTLQGKKYYVLKHSNYVLGVERKNKKNPAYYDLRFYPTSNIDERFKYLIFPDFEKALRTALESYNEPSLLPMVLKDDFINKYEFIEAKALIDNGNEINCLITTECADNFDESKIKSNRIKAAAKEEFSERFSREIVSKLLPKQADKDKLKKELAAFALQDGLHISEYKNFIGIDIEYDPMDIENIEHVIRNNIKFSQIDIVQIHQGKDLEIIPIGKKVDNLKKEVEEEFDVIL